MLKVAVIEDDKPTSDQFRRWIEKVRPDARVFQWFTREDAERAVSDTRYDVIVLDIELGSERNAGVAVLHAATADKRATTPVLVVSGMPADLYRGVMRALRAWDYLQKPIEQHEFVDAFLHILRRIAEQRPLTEELKLDPLKRTEPLWNEKRLNISGGDIRLLNALYERRYEPDPTVRHEELFDLVKSGRNVENVRRHISDIKKAFREIDPSFNCIETVPLIGYRWVDRVRAVTGQ